MGVEPTIRTAKVRIAGFEGREDHRALVASAGIIRGLDGLGKCGAGAAVEQWDWGRERTP